MGRKKYVIAGICLAVLAAGSGGGWWWFVDHPKSVVMKRVLDRLNDPDSAKFVDVRYDSKADAGCGAVNARNKMGGYTGFTGFLALKDGTVIFDPGESSSSDVHVKLEAIKTKIAWLELVLENCPDDKKS